MDQFQKKFIEEATDNINDLEDAILLLEDNPTDNELIERVFRAMHTLKGGGAMFGFDKISAFTHNLETIYDLVRDGKLLISKEILNITLLSVDYIKLLLDEENESEQEIKEKNESLTNQIMKIIDGIGESNAANLETESSTQEKSKEEDGGQLKTYYILFQPDENILKNGTNPLYLIDELHLLGECKALPRLNNIPEIENLNTEKCYVHWEVFLSTKENVDAIKDVFIFVEDDCVLEIHEISQDDVLGSEKFVEKIKEYSLVEENVDVEKLKKFSKSLGGKKKSLKEKILSVKKELATPNSARQFTKKSVISSIRVSSEKIDSLMNLVSELVTTQARLSLFAEQKSLPELDIISENVQKLTRQLRDNAFEISLIPIQNMLTRFQRLVRDLSGELNKEIVFNSEGAETELDKTIIESLTDPLLHILRNSIDHGIEDAETRAKLGKPKQGTILLKAFYSGANVHIQIKDDGAGIDVNRIREKAIIKGLIREDESLTKKEILNLIFSAGLSTAVKVTDVSGRGVGMDVVRRKITDIRGEVEIDSEINKGTTITIKLPLTLSIIDGLLVKIAEFNYIIPLSVVNKIYAVEHDIFKNNFKNIVVLDGEQIPYHYLRTYFNIPENTIGNEQVIIIEYEDQKIGLVVDFVVGEYQAVLKPLGRHYKEQDIISGATILGDGSMALVMDTNRIIKKFSNED